MSASRPAAKQLLTVDPATTRTGMACFDIAAKRLTWCALLHAKGKTVLDRSHEMADMAVGAPGWNPVFRDPAYRLVFEYPQVRKFGSGAKADPDDILAIVLVVGCMRRALPRPGREDFIRPSQWKSNTDPDAMTQHILSRLSADERKLTKVWKDDHNVVDACGMGLWVLERL